MEHLCFQLIIGIFAKECDFDYYKTQSVTGVLGKVALKRNDFIRTTNPIYSLQLLGKKRINYII